MDEKRLKVAMAMAGVSIEKLSRMCGMSTVSFYRKSRGITEFTLSEIVTIKNALKLTNDQMCTIFFAHEVS